MSENMFGYSASASYIAPQVWALNRRGRQHRPEPGQLHLDGPARHAVSDFDGDGKTDIGIFRPSNGRWYIRNLVETSYGQNGDMPVEGDWNGDGKADIAIFRPSNGADSLERMRREAKRTLARALARALPRAALTAPDVFDVWERAGYHITPVHFYSSIPNTAELREPPPSTCPGVELNRDAQRQSLEALAPLFAEGARHWEDNTYFGLVDSLALYAMVRRHRPCTVVEIGSGHSTRMIEAALAENAEGTLVTIEPYPERMSSPPTFASEVQEVPLSLFESLSTNDILFIDSTHVLRFGSDVQYEYLEILPRLRKGVLVHIHDVFLPGDYPRWWLTDLHRFWNEQYILQAFLAFNHAYEVLWSSQMLADEIAALLPDAPPGGSFWIRRV